MNIICLVSHIRYPKELLNSHTLDRGEWVAYTGNIDGVQLQACKFVDLKPKQFISTCSTTIPGIPRQTKYHGAVKRPQVAEFYLKYSASIDIHNHVRTGSLGMEDVFMTMRPQVGGYFCKYYKGREAKELK